MYVQSLGLSWQFCSPPRPPFSWWSRELFSPLKLLWQKKLKVEPISSRLLYHMAAFKKVGNLDLRNLIVRSSYAVDSWYSLQSLFEEGLGVSEGEGEESVLEGEEVLCYSSVPGASEIVLNILLLLTDLKMILACFLAGWMHCNKVPIVPWNGHF